MLQVSSAGLLTFMQVQTCKPNSAVAPTQSLLHQLHDHWRSPSFTPSKPTATLLVILGKSTIFGKGKTLPPSALTFIKNHVGYWPTVFFDETVKPTERTRIVDVKEFQKNRRLYQRQLPATLKPCPVLPKNSPSNQRHKQG
ncbi:unnamed protein product [Trichogramma brassicae]|uniref:Uncharacterized protein n=1 Tax=Trichogramma brassicae TaxID=86971 RepID=A0A6H5I487_9HYME|nr:unnamed protein product [Trichogramma brassicae]